MLKFKKGPSLSKYAQEGSFCYVLKKYIKYIENIQLTKIICYI